MIEGIGARAPGPLGARLAFAGLAAALLALALLPLRLAPPPWGSPDLLLLLALAFAARRPDGAPLLLVAAVALLADLLLERPPGLMAALVVLATEALRRRAPQLRAGGFAAEWIAVAVAATGALLAHRLVLAVVMTPQAPLALALMQAVLTAAAYPALAGLLHLLLGPRRGGPGEADPRGGPA